MYLSRIKMWSLTNKLDSSIYRGLQNSKFQICFSCISKHVFRFSFLTTLDIYKDYFKGRLSGWNLMQRLLQLLLHSHCDRRQNLPYFIFLLKKLLCLYTVGFCDQGASSFSSSGWAEGLCSQQPSQVGVLVMYKNPCIDWLVTYLESCIERRDCNYITSPIVYWGKGSTVGWYKVLGFLYL